MVGFIFRIHIFVILLLLTAFLSFETSSKSGLLLLNSHAAPFAGTPYTGSAISLPGRIEAENFDIGGEGVAYHDTTSNNDGGYYRAEGVDVCTCGSPYGLSVGWTQSGEWMEYTVSVGAYGTYKFQPLTATIISGSALHIEVDGVNITGQMTLPNTNSWSAYAATSSPAVTLTPGQHIVRVVIDVTGFLLDSVDVIRLNTPYGGTASQVPGTIPAENFDNGGEGIAYHDTTSSNDGGAYRSEGVDLCFCGYSSGAALGWSFAGEWTKYTVNVSTADSYTLQPKMSTTSSGNTIHFELDGVNVTGPMVLPNTGWWDNWTTIAKPNVQISAGQHEIKMVIETGGFLFDSFDVLPSVPVTPSGLAANAVSSTQINLIWVDNSFNETGFKLERKVGPSGSYSEITTTAAGVNSFSDTGLQSGTQYFYRLRATNLGGISAYSNEASATPSNLPPSVSLTSPAGGTVFTAPANVTIDAFASDPDGTVSKVEFFQGSTKLGEDLSAPYNFNWPSVTAGTYSLTARATDNLGGTTTSPSVAITVNAPPTVSLTAPAANAVFNAPANITISASALDSDGTITKVQFFRNGTLLSEDTASPFSFDWSNVQPGTYSLSAVATDNRGAATTSTTVSINVVANGISRLDPMDRTGGGAEDPLSRNFNWNLPLVHLPGRAGMDLELTLSYNSLVWNKSGNTISFDEENGFPAAGFRLGLPIIQGVYYNNEAGKYAYLLIAGDGSRTELRQVDTYLFESTDSAHLLLDTSLSLPPPDNDKFVLRTTDGTRMLYAWKGTNYQCTEIKDRNGNYTTINYTASGRVNTINDTLNRVITFNYDSNGWLTSITQVWNQSTTPLTHYWARFEYTNVTIDTNFPGLTVVGPADNSTIKVLSKVTLADDSHFDFSYTSWGQIWKLSNFAADNHLLNYHSYNLPQTGGTGLEHSDCPRFTERHDWAQYWNGDADGIAATNEEAITSFAVSVSESWTMPDGSSQTGVRAQVTAPDLTSNKIYFIGTAGTSSGWRRGLPALVNTYDSSGVLQRQVMTTWTQDNTSASYQLNPRVIETNTYDPAGNRARVQFTYQQITLSSNTSCQLPRDVYEYAANATTILRSRRSDYNNNTVYLDRRIIGLISERRLYDGDVNNGGVLMSQVGLFYDESGSILGTDMPVQHDNTNYSASFVTGRANVSSVRRYDVTNTAQFTTSSSKYNTTGAVVSTTDASNHTVQISYADSFSDNNNSRNTLAYPTTATDADGYTSIAKYQFDFGGMTYKRTPQPNTTQDLPGPEQTLTYDSIGRAQQITNLVNNAYTRFEYAASSIRLDAYTTIQEGLGEAHSFRITDGHGRVIGTATDHPGSTGGFSGQRFVYDVMDRVIKTSNPTETNASGTPFQWVTAGDDAAAGWIYTEQTYDWKGRSLITSNQDGTTRTASYTGCGCAGGEVVTLTDEGTLDAGVTKRRQQRVYSDVLGRTVKTQLLNWEGGAVYATTVNIFNARDQVTQIREFAGDESSSTYQDSTVTYDGYGRVRTKHLPEQNSGTSTTWDYNNDDTVQRVTDARGATTNYTYNNRHLVTGIAYTGPSGIPVPAPVSFAYDATGNRTAMTDGTGSTTYSYDLLSRLTSESRSFNGLAGTYALNYSYNLGNALTVLSIPFRSQQIGYNYDSANRLSGVTASGFTASVYPYTQTITSLASDISYRAWGASKNMTYGNTTSEQLQYDSRLRPTSYTLYNMNYQNTNVCCSFPTYSTMTWTFGYYDDGRVKQAWDATNEWFDRAYKYDHVGRLKEATTYRRAHGLSAFPANNYPDPYYQSISYDSFNHTSRSGLFYTAEPSDMGTWVNNRRTNPGWAYDADGNNIVNPNHSQTFDAAGRQSHSVSAATVGYPYQPQLDITTDYDGAGMPAKRVQISRQPGLIDELGHQDPPIEDIQTTYYLNSSVLGGATVVELNGPGSSDTVNIYANGQRIAREVQASVVFEHHNPVTGSWVTSLGHSSYRTTNREERDSFGAEIPTSNPFPLMQSYVDLKFGQPLFVEGSDPFDYSGGCKSFGMPISCGDAARLVAGGLGQMNGIAVSQPNPRGPQQAIAGSSKIVDETVIQLSHVWLTGHGPGEWRYYRDTVRKVVNVPLAGQAKQNPTNKGTPLPGSEVDRLKSALASVLKDSKCSSFVKALLNQIGLDTNRIPFSDNIVDIFDAVRKQGGFGKRQMSDTAEGGSTVGNGDAYINIGNWTFADDDFALAGVGRTMIHELLHVGSSTSLDYTHYQMFKAAYAVAKRLGGFTLGRKPGEKDPGGKDYPSAYAFDDILFQACRVR